VEWNTGAGGENVGAWGPHLTFMSLIAVQVSLQSVMFMYSNSKGSLSWSRSWRDPLAYLQGQARPNQHSAATQPSASPAKRPAIKDAQCWVEEIFAGSTICTHWAMAMSRMLHLLDSLQSGSCHSSQNLAKKKIVKGGVTTVMHAISVGKSSLCGHVSRNPGLDIQGHNQITRRE